MPMNMDIRFGSFSRLTELPISSSTLGITNSLPTTVRRSPTCSGREANATISTPARFTRVTFMPCNLRSCNEPRVFPFNSDFVTMNRRLTKCDSVGIHCFLSICTSVPMKLLITAAFCGLVITKTLSFSFRTVSECASEILLVRESIVREIT